MNHTCLLGVVLEFGSFCSLLVLLPFGAVTWVWVGCLVCPVGCHLVALTVSVGMLPLLVLWPCPPLNCLSSSLGLAGSVVVCYVMALGRCGWLRGVWWGVSLFFCRGGFCTNWGVFIFFMLVWFPLLHVPHHCWCSIVVRDVVYTFGLVVSGPGSSISLCCYA